MSAASLVVLMNLDFCPNCTKRNRIVVTEDAMQCTACGFAITNQQAKELLGPDINSFHLWVENQREPIKYPTTPGKNQEVAPHVGLPEGTQYLKGPPQTR